jgi:hypothetical protein
MPTVIESVEDANIYIRSALLSHATMWDRVNNIEDYTIRMKKPFDESELKTAGLGWVTNFNYGKGKAFIEYNLSQNIADLIRSISFAEVDFVAFDKKKHTTKTSAFLANDALRQRISYGIVSCFIQALEQDNDFYTWANIVEYNAFMFGRCAITYDEDTYLGYPHHIRNIAYEDHTQMNRIDNFMLFDLMKATHLHHKMMESQGMATTTHDLCGTVHTFYENGYCKEAMEEVFKMYCESEFGKGNRKYTGLDVHSSWESIQNQIQGLGIWGDILSNLNNLYIGKIFYFDDKSHLIETWVVLTRNLYAEYSNVNVSSSCCLKHLLYRKDRGVIEQSKIINIVREFSISTNNYINELTGYGTIIAQTSYQNDVKKCRLEDKLAINGSPFIKETSAYEGQEVGIAVVGGFNILKEGVNLEMAQHRFNLNDQITSLKLDEADFNRDTKGIDPSLNLSSRPSSDEVQAAQQNASAARASRIPIKLSDYSVTLREALLNLSSNNFEGASNIRIKTVRAKFFDELKKEFLDLDIEDDEFDDVIKHITFLVLNPVNNNIAALKEAMAMAGSSESRTRLKKMYLAALGFSRKDIWEMVQIEDYGTQTSIAALENAAFVNTAEIAWGPEQDHISHLNIHYAKADRIMQGVSQGEDLVRAFNELVNLLTNTDKHVNFLETQPFYADHYNTFKDIQKFFEDKARMLAQEVEKIKQQAAQAQQQAAQEGGQGGGQPPISPKDQADMYNDRLKTMDKIKRTNEQSQLTASLKQEAFLREQARKDAQVAADIERSKQKDSVKLQTSQAAAQIELSKKALG